MDYDKKDGSYDTTKSLVNEDMKHYFCPKFLNRLDEDDSFLVANQAMKEVAVIGLKGVLRD